MHCGVAARLRRLGLAALVAGAASAACAQVMRMPLTDTTQQPAPYATLPEVDFPAAGPVDPGPWTVAPSATLPDGNFFVERLPPVETDFPGQDLGAPAVPSVPAVSSPDPAPADLPRGTRPGVFQKLLFEALLATPRRDRGIRVRHPGIEDRPGTALPHAGVSPADYPRVRRALSAGAGGDHPAAPALRRLRRVALARAPGAAAGLRRGGHARRGQRLPPEQQPCPARHRARHRRLDLLADDHAGAGRRLSRPHRRALVAGGRPGVEAQRRRQVRTGVSAAEDFPSRLLERRPQSGRRGLGSTSAASWAAAPGQSSAPTAPATCSIIATSAPFWASSARHSGTSAPASRSATSSTASSSWTRRRPISCRPTPSWSAARWPIEPRRRRATGYASASVLSRVAPIPLLSHTVQQQEAFQYPAKPSCASGTPTAELSGPTTRRKLPGARAGWYTAGSGIA